MVNKEIREELKRLKNGSELLIMHSMHSMIIGSIEKGILLSKKLEDKITKKESALKSATESVTESVTEAIETTTEEVEGCTEVKAKSVNRLKKLATKVVEKCTEIKTNLVDGLKKGINIVKENVMKLKTNVVNGCKKAINITKKGYEKALTKVDEVKVRLKSVVGMFNKSSKEVDEVSSSTSCEESNVVQKDTKKSLVDVLRNINDAVDRKVSDKKKSNGKKLQDVKSMLSEKKLQDVKSMLCGMRGLNMPDNKIFAFRSNLPACI